ncbi:sigma-70 family RNA polymerase sigma factor [bacterium]|nr:sigma-70 family RNA polymerase sigma factor [bacterium]
MIDGRHPDPGRSRDAGGGASGAGVVSSAADDGAPEAPGGGGAPTTVPGGPGGGGAPTTVEDAERAHSLARSFRDGDQDAFGELVDIFKERFYRIAFRILGNTDDALDVTQDSFVRIHRGIAGWDERAAFFSWSYRIVTNLAIDALRKKGRDRRARTQAALERPEAHEDPSPEHLDLTAEDRSRLVERARDAIAALPPGQRAIVALRHYENLSLKDIAEIRGCAVGTVKSTLHQAFNSLRKMLGGGAGSLATVARRELGDKK